MRRNRDRVHVTTVVLAGLLAGLLIWSKLRLVTDIPRSAFADPREVVVEDKALADPKPEPSESAQSLRHELAPMPDEHGRNPEDQAMSSEPTASSSNAVPRP